jgi:hypothetical protein
MSELSVCPSRDSTVGIATGYGAGQPRVESESQ